MLNDTAAGAALYKRVRGLVLDMSSPVALCVCVLCGPKYSTTIEFTFHSATLDRKLFCRRATTCQALILDSTNVEAIACIASQHFYTDQPEIALQFYKRLAQMGYNSAELWNNMGLCSFYSSQYHTALQFFAKALDAAGDENMADVW